MKLVIKGAYYYDRESDAILIPHFTGEYFRVDCTRYIRMKELKENHDQSYINSVKDKSIKFEEKKYYDDEYSLVGVNKDWELLSDLSNLMHVEEEFNF